MNKWADYRTKNGTRHCLSLSIDGIFSSVLVSELCVGLGYKTRRTHFNQRIMMKQTAKISTRAANEIRQFLCENIFLKEDELGSILVYSNKLTFHSKTGVRGIHLENY